MRLGLVDLGWPIVVLAAAGAWALRSDGAWRSRLGLLIAACAVTYLVFVVFSVWVPVDARFQRYTDEFISRVNYVTIPAAVILAARGAAWAWAAGTPARAAAAVLLAAGAVIGVQRWAAWLG